MNQKTKLYCVLGCGMLIGLLNFWTAGRQMNTPLSTMDWITQGGTGILVGLGIGAILFCAGYAALYSVLKVEKRFGPMKTNKVSKGLEKKAGRIAGRSGMASGILAVLVGTAMIVVAVLLSNVYMGATHVVEPGSVIAVDSTYPSADMMAGENFSFYINWTANHDVKDVVLNVEIIKPDATLTDASLSFAWVASDGTLTPVVLTDLGSKFVVLSEPASAVAGVVMSYQAQMAYNVGGDWNVQFSADGSLA